jgi:hypothetical protein
MTLKHIFTCSSTASPVALFVVLTRSSLNKFAMKLIESCPNLVIGDALGYNKGTVSRVVDNVTNALIARKDQFIKWPTDNHMQNKIRYGFFQQFE